MSFKAFFRRCFKSIAPEAEDLYSKSKKVGLEHLETDLLIKKLKAAKIVKEIIGDSDDGGVIFVDPVIGIKIPGKPLCIYQARDRSLEQKFHSELSASQQNNPEYVLDWILTNNLVKTAVVKQSSLENRSKAGQE